MLLVTCVCWLLELLPPPLLLLLLQARGCLNPPRRSSTVESNRALLKSKGEDQSGVESSRGGRGQAGLRVRLKHNSAASPFGPASP